jgi:hypothetical protein
MRRFVVLAILSISIAAGACQPGASGITFAPSQGALMTLVDMSGACAIPKAWGGPASSNPIPLMTPCSKTSPPYATLPGGSLVTTSTCGQAWLQVAECGKLYVFHTTKLVASFCNPAYPAPAGCITSGTAAWSGKCVKHLELGTPSASVRLAGTWASVTYVEDRQLSLFVLIDGSGEATPFLDADATKVGDPTTVRASEFWFSAPGDVAPVVAGVEGRVAQPLDQLPAVIHELGLESWFAEVLDQAEEDGFDVAQTVQLPVVQVRLAGGPLEGAAMRDAALRSFDWGVEAEALLPDGAAAALLGLAGDDPVVDLRTVGFDPSFSQVAIKDAGSFGVDVVWRKGDIERYAAAFVEALRSVGLDVAEQPVADGAAAAELFDADVAAERAVIWMSEH